MSPRKDARFRRAQKRQYVGTIRANVAEAPEIIQLYVLEVLGLDKLPDKRGLMALSPDQLGSAARLLDCWVDARSADGRKIAEEIERLERVLQHNHPNLLRLAARQPSRVRLALLRWAIKEPRRGGPCNNPGHKRAPRANSLSGNGGVEAFAPEPFAEGFATARRRAMAAVWAETLAALKAPSSDGDDQPDDEGGTGLTRCLNCNPDADPQLGWTEPDSPNGLCESCRHLYDDEVLAVDHPTSPRLRGTSAAASSAEPVLEEPSDPVLEFRPAEQLTCSLCGRAVPETEAWTIKKQWRRIPEALSEFFDRHFGQPLCGDCGLTARNLALRWRKEHGKRQNPFWTHRWQ
jgi:hypothetical protein